MPTLFSPLQLGDILLANRIVMAPLTRNRAPRGIPNDLMVEYYRQRASAGLIVSEGSPISPTAAGYLDTPGIYSPQQVAGWRKVTDAVHAAGGKMVCQLWHVGRISHASLLPEGQAPVSSTCKPPLGGKTFTRKGFESTTPPRALDDGELPALIADYRRAARNARQAGFDGVEIHAANTYLLEQFLRDSINNRAGPYGGTAQNRIRLVVEVAQAVADEIGAGRVGIRISPLTSFGGSGPRDSAPQALYGLLLDSLAALGLAYVHIIEGETGGPRQPLHAPKLDYADLRRRAGGSGWVVNNGYTRTTALRAVATGAADAVAFGRPFIGNPDLVERLRANLPLAKAQAATFYGGGAAGYTDYPRADGAAVGV